MKTMTDGGGGDRVATAATAQVPGPGQALQRNPTINPDRINEEQRRRLEERVSPTVEAPTRPDVEAPPPAAATAGTAAEVRFTLTGVTFDPSSYLTRAELDALVQPLIGREVVFSELQTVVDRINTRYATLGLTTARALLPAQQIDGGRVVIRLVEGRIGATTVEGGSAGTQRYAQVRGGVPTGTLAAPATLEDKLRLFNLNNDAQLRARLVPGSDFGTTDVALAVTEPPRISGRSVRRQQRLRLDRRGGGRRGAPALPRAERCRPRVRRAGRVARRAEQQRVARASRSATASGSASSGAYGRTRVIFGPIAPLGVRGTSFSFGARCRRVDRRAGSLDDHRQTGAVQTSLSRTTIAGERVIENEALNASLGGVASYAVPGFAATLQSQATFATVKERLSGNVFQPVLFQGSALVAKAWCRGCRPGCGRIGSWRRSRGCRASSSIRSAARGRRGRSTGHRRGRPGHGCCAELAYGAIWDGWRSSRSCSSTMPRVRCTGLKAVANSAGTWPSHSPLHPTSSSANARRGIPSAAASSVEHAPLRLDDLPLLAGDHGIDVKRRAVDRT